MAAERRLLGGKWRKNVADLRFFVIVFMYCGICVNSRALDTIENVLDIKRQSTVNEENKEISNTAASRLADRINTYVNI